MKTARELYVNVFVPDYAAVHKTGVIPDFRKLILDILEAGKAADKRYTQTTLANRCNTNQANISRWSKGSIPEDEHRPLIFKEARRFGIDLAKYGVLEAKALQGSTPADDEYRFVGAYEQSASAGPGSFAEDGQPLYNLAFRRDWLRRITRAPDEALFVLFADGDSMEPTIHDGDSMLIDQSQNVPTKDGIYVFRADDLLNVKRLTYNPRAKTVTISSDNPVYDKFTGIKPTEINVVGRVIWIGRKI